MFRWLWRPPPTHQGPHASTRGRRQPSHVIVIARHEQPQSPRCPASMFTYSLSSSSSDRVRQSFSLLAERGETCTTHTLHATVRRVHKAGGVLGHLVQLVEKVDRRKGRARRLCRVRRGSTREPGGSHGTKRAAAAAAAAADQPKRRKKAGRPSLSIRYPTCSLSCWA